MSYPCACSSYGCNCRCFTSRFKDESFVYYKLVWHIPWNKANTVTLFFLEFLNPPPLKWKQSTESFFNRTMLFRFLSYKVFRRMHLSKVQDFAGLQLCWAVRITVLRYLSLAELLDSVWWSQFRIFFLLESRFSESTELIDAKSLSFPDQDR